MPTVDIITAAGPNSDGFLPRLAASIFDQPTVPGWALSWLVVADGPDGEENAHRAAHASDLGARRVWVNHDRYWAGASRNRALAHSTADLVVIVDADDTLTAAAATSWAHAHTKAPGTWCAFQTVDWYPREGRTVEFPDVSAPGAIPAGLWLDFFNRTGHHPAHPITVLWPHEMLVALGGWAANPAVEDASPILVGSTRWSGWWTSEPTHLYRKHAGQVTHGGRSRPVAQAAADGLLLATKQASFYC